MTDDNGLLYMRQRYYNSTIKRFINQDILTGNITDSQSLNRYSYVEGDPINYVDPFGLSKLRNTLDSLTNNLSAITEFLAHPISNTGKFLGNVWSHMDTYTKLNILGTLPVIGYVFDIANAISYFKEGKVAEGVESLIFALPTLNIADGAGKIAQLLGKSKHSADIIGNTLQLCSTAAAAFTAACKTGTGIANIIDKYAVNGAPLDGQFLADVGEVASYGLMTTVFGRMTVKDYQSYSEAANTIVKGTVVNNEEIEWYTEDDYLQEIASKGGNDTNRSLITGDDWNMYFREKYGYDKVNWETAYDSPNDIIVMPSRVTDMNPDGLYNYLQAEKLDIKPLGQGVNEGKSFSEGGGYKVHFDSKYGASYIQYNPFSSHHKGIPYYKVSSGNIFEYSCKRTGIQRFTLDGKVLGGD